MIFQKIHFRFRRKTHFSVKSHFKKEKKTLKFLIIFLITNFCIDSYFIGCDIFDELCLRIDVNQKYAELLPQWKDVAHQLEIDQLMTKWVEVCVRPKEGLARAMLEIYMKDGGKYILTYLFKKNNSNDHQVLFPKVNLYF